MIFRWIGARPKERSATSHHVRLRLEELEDRCVPSATDLGIAGEFNAFVFNDYTGYWSDVEGRLAVGRDATLSGYGIGDRLTDSNGTRDDLIVGDDLSYQNGQVFNGNVVYGTSASMFYVGVPNGTVRQDHVIDFNAAQTELTDKSTTWAALGTNGTIENNWGGLTLTGTNATLNVFNLSAAQLQNIWGLTINAPAGSTVLVNVTGTNVTLQYFGMNVNGTDRNHVLFNLHEAEQVTLQGIGFQGSILAPDAHVTFNNGNLTGTLVSNCFTGQGQMNDAPIRINIPESIPSTLSGRVFNDKNDDGEQQSGEAGVQDVTLILTGQGVSIYLTDTTDENGDFSFEDLPAGQYTAAIVVPDGNILVSIHVGSESGTDSLGTGEITDIPIESGDNAIEYNFGIRVPRTGGGG